MVDGYWQVQLAALAKQDYRQILRWSAEKFGAAQAQHYANTLSATLQDLSAGPDIAGVKERSDISPGIKMLHVARKGRKGSHIVLFRVASKQHNAIVVLRMLHERMDLARHLPFDETT
jgi:toxin ParE1/3/4